MSTVSSIVSSATQGTESAASQGLAGLSGSDFMNLLIQQLTNQDPLQPMSNAEMLNQISTIREVEMNSRLTERLESLTEQQRFGSSAALIGKKVKGTVTDENGLEYPKEGIVISVVYSPDGSINLQLDNGDTLPLTGLEEVSDAADKTTATTGQKSILAA